MSSEASRENFNFQKIVVIVGISLFIIKFAAWYITQSVAVLTDAMESTINVVSAFIGLFSLYISMKPRDISHPNGHGKVEFLSAGAEGTMITLAGLVIIYKAVYNIFYPSEITKLDYGIILVAFTAVVNYVTGYFAVRRGRKNGSIALVAGGKHLQSDTYSTIGIIIGLILIMVTGKVILDSLVAVLFGVIIVCTGAGIIRKSIAGVMDELDITLLNDFIQVLDDNRRDNWIDIHNIRMTKYGSHLHINCHMTMPWFLNVREVHEEKEHLEKIVSENFKEDIEIFIQPEPCCPSSCPVCLCRNCSCREHAFIQRVSWNAETLFHDDQHDIEKTGGYESECPCDNDRDRKSDAE